MKVSQIRSLCISDIHLGHAKNSTEEIIHNLDVFLNQYNNKKLIDILFLAGDVFDKMLHFSDKQVNVFTLWAWRLVKFCERNNIKLRVLEGTPYHDRGQSKMFETIAQVSNSHADVKYFDSIYIEHIEDFGIDILYIPDNNDPETYDHVCNLMESKNLTQVDLAIMHGAFKFQMVEKAHTESTHIESDYLSIVKYYIMIGHIHIGRVYERIMSPSSFDRLAHGEEGPKGGVYFVINDDGTMNHFFIENKLSKIFKSITIRSKDLESSIEYIRRQTNKFPSGSHIRLKALKDSTIFKAFDEVKSLFPNLKITKQALEDESVAMNELVSDNDTTQYAALRLDRTNLNRMLIEIVDGKYLLESPVRTALLSELKMAM